MALPRIKANDAVSCLESESIKFWQLTVYVALPFVSLSDEEICYVPSYPVFVTNSISAKHFLQP